MFKSSKTRIANGVVAAFVACFFAVHGMLGAFESVLPLSGRLVWTVWVGVGFVGVHVLISVATSYQKLTDSARPPSARKKRHLTLKWATGIVLAMAVGAHIACMRSPDVFSAVSPAAKLVTVAVAVILAWHVCVGMKSLLKDIGLSKKLIVPLRVLTCVLAAAIGLVVLL